MNKDLKIIKGILNILENYNDEYSEKDIAIIDGLNRIFNERWITVHPHGDDSDDYRRLKLEDGESPKEAIDRVYKKEDKSKDSKSSKSFVNATNLADAIKETNNYIKDIRPAITQMSLDNFNKINSGLSYIYHNVCKFEPLKEIKKSRMDALAAANSQELVIGSMFDFDEQKSKEEFNREVTNWLEDNKKAIEHIKNDPYLTSRQKTNRIKKYEENMKYNRFGVYSSPENLIKETIIHELGHTISYQAIKKDKVNGSSETALLLRETMRTAKNNGDIYKISAYSSKDSQEFFAECFLMYNIGEKQPDYIKNMVERVIKKL